MAAQLRICAHASHVYIICNPTTVQTHRKQRGGSLNGAAVSWQQCPCPWEPPPPLPQPPQQQTRAFAACPCRWRRCPRRRLPCAGQTAGCPPLPVSPPCACARFAAAAGAAQPRPPPPPPPAAAHQPSAATSGSAAAGTGRHRLGQKAAARGMPPCCRARHSVQRPPGGRRVPAPPHACPQRRVLHALQRVAPPAEDEERVGHKLAAALRGVGVG